MDFEKVKELIVETLGCDAEDVTPEASLKDDLGADSLSAVELCMALEENSGVEIADEQIAEMKTVADILTFLQISAE